MKRYLIFILGLIFLLFSCKKAPESPLTTNKITIPVVITVEVSQITMTSAVSGGEVTNAGNGTITARGVCWDTQHNPTLDNNDGYTTNGNGTGSFISNITGLTENTAYFVAAYATNEKGTSYGEVKSFQTILITLPDVITSNVSQIEPPSAISGGEVTNAGNGTVTARGICWDTSDNPTLENNLSITIDGSGVGSFISNITGLSYSMQYFVCAYATNEKGTSYGEVKSFVIQLSCGELTLDYGGQVYHTVLIGNQCWFRENLNIGNRIDGSQEQTNNSIIEKYCYNDNEANCDTYGGLYQWNEMMQYVATQGTKGICPDGWHLPADAEWTVLTDYLGGLGIAGGKMKEIGTTHWNTPNAGATNSSGFTALPGGYRDTNGYFNNLNNFGIFWSSSQSNASNTWRRLLYYDGDGVYRSNYNKGYGFLVRCLQD